MTADRITYAQLGQLRAGREDTAARAITAAVHGINSSERDIRQAAATITRTLAETVTRLDHGLGLNPAGELRHAPADLDRAITLREHNWQILGALLTDAEMEALKPAAPPAR